MWSKVRETQFKLFGHRCSMDSLPSLIHAHFADDGAMVLPLAAKPLNLPLVVTCHGHDVFFNHAERKFSIHQLLYRCRIHSLQKTANLFIAVSDFLRGELIKRGYPSEKVVRHYIGIDRTKFQPNWNMEREPIVLFVGRLVEIKGCEYLLQAMADVQRVMPHVKWVVIGDGPLPASLEARAQQMLSNYAFLGV